MSPNRSLTDIAREILKNAELLDSSATSDSGNVSDLLRQPPSHVPKDLRRIRRDLMEASLEMQVAITGPSEYLEQHHYYYQSLSCLHWLCQFGIFNLVPQDMQPISYELLATKAAVPLSHLHCVARASIAFGLFTEPTPSTIAHNVLSYSFIADPDFFNWAKFISKWGGLQASVFPEATASCVEADSKMKTAFNIAFQTDMSPFQYFKATPGMTEMFASYMRATGKTDSMSEDHVIAGYGWAVLCEHTHVIDIGGSNGHISIALATAYPQLRFTVQDLPYVTDTSKSTLDNLDPNIASRIEFVSHDFFNPQPRETIQSFQTIYLLRRILHDWSDVDALKILNHLGTSLTKAKQEDRSARILIMDTILPQPGQLPRMQELGMRIRDLTMAQTFNTRERELDDWKTLFGKAVPQLQIRGHRTPAGSAMGIMEVVLA